MVFQSMFNDIYRNFKRKENKLMDGMVMSCFCYILAGYFIILIQVLILLVFRFIHLHLVL